jgi:uncharacterized glyoxalase superfamily protein PhnB
MTDLINSASPTRVVSYAGGVNPNASRVFYTEVLGFDVAMDDPVLGLTSPANHNAQVLIPPAGFENPQPRFGVDLGNPEAVDAAHAAAVGRGLRVVYPLTDEPWGVRRFFVQDPGGTIINVLAHTAGRTPNIRPRLVVEDVDATIAYYERFLGAASGPRYAEPSGLVVHAEVRIGDSTISLTQAYDDYRLYSPESAASSPVLLTLTVADSSAVGAAMVEGGATVIVSIEDRPWGKREGRIRDPFGHLWVISQDLTPAS